MMAAIKTAYTSEQTLELVEAYKAMPTAETVEQFAVKFSKTVKSVIAKLSREGVYQKKEYVSKAGTKPVKKEELATELMEAFGLSDAEADSLAKANKTALQKILAKVKG
jgi:Zn-dependent M32 family carboxypeptidase